MFWNLPGDALDAMDEAGVDYDQHHESFEVELERRWSEKVRAGTRDLQREDEQPHLSYMELRTSWPDK
jgi:hypothetical protein